MQGHFVSRTSLVCDRWSVVGGRLACALALVASFSLAHAGTPLPGQPDTNLVPNSAMRGSYGAVATSNGSIVGEVPTLWRAVAVDGGDMTLTRIMLPANTLFVGSPATEAVQITVNSFGLEQVLDHGNAVFSIQPGQSYGARIYVRSGNANNSSQSFSFSMPFFDANLNFAGRDPSNFVASASSTWSSFDSSDSLVLPGEAFAHIALRLIDDGGENSIILAMPSVSGPAVHNAAPNPGYSGNSGLAEGMVTGSVPDDWRAFAVGSESLTVSTVALSADTLYPGSPATNAIRLQVSGGDGTFEGFDHEAVRAALQTNYQYWGEMYMRSGNALPQTVTVSFPVFNPDGSFSGSQPGAFLATVGTQWSLYAGPQFSASAGQTANLAFRLFPNGGEDSIMIALPRIVSPTGPTIYADGFEDS